MFSGTYIQESSWKNNTILHFATWNEQVHPIHDALLQSDSHPLETLVSIIIIIKLNGAELPCGTTIKVEASDPLYKLRKSKGTNDSCPPVEPVKAETPAEKDEDLDDFFASLDGDDDWEAEEWWTKGPHWVYIW